ncbi:unnamed protein product [Paramecium sonneborni]|uniref:Uncharacterized protein n=1 Tax=Paramecium sonneborni TaxID=65129 RepID=A0A8S1LJD7_9CILI|nr:unnamed protein product [Paramecium sonneborni]
MIRKIIYNIVKFQTVQFQANHKFQKIQQNQTIHRAGNTKDLFQFYQSQGATLNLINLVSYIRKYTDFMISNQQVDNETEIQHAFTVLNQLSEMIYTKKYLQYKDKNSDHKRSFIMLLSLSVEMFQRSRDQMNQNRFLQSAKLAIKSIKEENRLKDCNIDEISVLLRCITQINELNPTEAEEIEYWALIGTLINQLTPHHSCKLLHSLSKFRSFNENLIGKLLHPLQYIENKDINQKDAISLFFSFKQISDKTKKFDEIIQSVFIFLQTYMIRQSFKLHIKYIGMIYNVLATLPIEINQDFLTYLEIQLIQSNNLSMLCLAHLFQLCFSKPELNITINKKLEDKIIFFLNQSCEIDDIQNAEQFIMFFNTIGSHCTLMYIEIFIPILKKMPINDFIIGKMFSGLLKITLASDYLQEITDICILRLKQYDNAINIHALNSIYRAKCLQNAKYSNLFQDIVNYQINKYNEQIFLKDYQFLINNKKYFESFEFLQVLTDFLKIYTFTGNEGKENKKIISDNLQELKKIIKNVKNQKVEQNAQQFLDYFDDFLQSI